MRYIIKYLRLLGLVGLLIGIMILAVDCAPATKPIETEEDFIGFITEIHPSQERDMLGQISVESHADKIVTKYIITIKDETLIFQQDGDNLHKVSFGALENKQWVKIWLMGPIMESWPMQGTAKQVVIEKAVTKPADEPIESEPPEPTEPEPTGLE